MCLSPAYANRQFTFLQLRFEEAYCQPALVWRSWRYISMVLTVDNYGDACWLGATEKGQSCNKRFWCVEKAYSTSWEGHISLYWRNHDEIYYKFSFGSLYVFRNDINYSIKNVLAEPMIVQWKNGSSALQFFSSYSHENSCQLGSN